MDDIRRQDLRLFVRELLNPVRLVIAVAVLAVLYKVFEAQGMLKVGSTWCLVLLVVGVMAYNDSLSRRWLNGRMEALWKGCQDRLNRFEEVLKKMRKDQIADLHEMPATIRNVSQSLYTALRRADMIAHEVERSERGLYTEREAWGALSQDPQSKELYRIADKNIAEYRSQLAGVMAGVQRTEAQSAVFMTTLDTLRMKMLGYRLVGRSPELSSHDFLEALAEARAQLQSIDTALEELDLGHYPKTIAAVPPPMPEDAVRRIKVNDGGD